MADQAQDNFDGHSNSPWPGDSSAFPLAWGVIQTIINAMKLFH